MNSITLPNGQTAVSFVPEDSKELAIVHLSTIRRLSKMLPSVPLSSIKHDLKERILASKDLVEVCSVMEEELAFHQSVNLIQKYDPNLSGTAEVILEKKGVEYTLD